MNQLIKLYKFLIVLVILSSCSTQEKIKIAISKGSGHPSYENYSKWLKNFHSNIEMIDLYAMEYEKALEVMNEVDGLVMSGGVDLHPGRFGRAEDASKCEIDLKRDTLEFAILEKAINSDIPILGICRGLQMINVYQEGSLIVDIPSENNSTLHQTPEPGDAFHDVSVMPDTKLARLTGAEIENVNSNHHQAIDLLGKNLIPTSYATDDIVESIEWQDTTGLPWMLAVQWHPERLDNKKMSELIALEFLKAVKVRLGAVKK